MTTISREHDKLVDFAIIQREGQPFDPLKAAWARNLRLWSKFGIAPTRIKFSQEDKPPGLLVTFPGKLTKSTGPRSA